MHVQYQRSKHLRVLYIPGMLGKSTSVEALEGRAAWDHFGSQSGFDKLWFQGPWWHLLGAKDVRSIEGFGFL